MKRDLDLMRRLLEEIKNLTLENTVKGLLSVESDESILRHHMFLLVDGGYIVSKGGNVLMTNKGHDYLEHCREEDSFERYRKKQLSELVSEATSPTDEKDAN